MNNVWMSSEIYTSEGGYADLKNIFKDELKNKKINIVDHSIIFKQKDVNDIISILKNHKLDCSYIDMDITEYISIMYEGDYIKICNFEEIDRAECIKKIVSKIDSGIVDINEIFNVESDKVNDYIDSLIDTQLIDLIEERISKMQGIIMDIKNGKPLKWH